MWLSTLRRWITETRKSTPRGRHQSGSIRRPKRTCRPSLEVLEDRAVPATFIVTSLDDIGLRGAIDQANASFGSDTITFAPAIKGGTVNMLDRATDVGPAGLCNVFVQNRPNALQAG